MRSFIAFLKKEFMEQMRSGKLLILGIIFVLFGVMNPAVAKLTPWLLEMLADSLAESGMVVTLSEVTALDSWLQFYKNIPMALVAFILIESNVITKETVSGTLILTLSKGFERYKVVIADTVALLFIWTLGYWLTFGITYLYNGYFWDNSVAKNIGFSAFAYWLFGVLVCMLIIVFSSVMSTNGAVLLSTGGTVAVFYMISFIPKTEKILPTALTAGTSLIYGVTSPVDYTGPVIVTVALSVASVIFAVIAFDRKRL